MKKNIALDPVQVGIVRTIGVMFQTQLFTAGMSASCILHTLHNSITVGGLCVFL